MNTIYFDQTMSDQVRRELLFGGQLFVFSPRPSSIALCEFADELIKKAFGNLSPEKAQYSLPVEEYAAILSKLKPMFINHPKSKECIQGIVKEFGCDPRKTYFDVPRMRTSTSDGYLTTGIAYAWHPHRDTWYSAPQCQINWWIPIYGIDANHGVAFHPRYWSDPISNDSKKYNYYQWNKEFRPNASQHLKEIHALYLDQRRRLHWNFKFAQFVRLVESLCLPVRNCTLACLTCQVRLALALISGPFIQMIF